MKISVKKIIALLLSIVFCYLSIMNKITSEQFMNVFTVIIGAYFGFSIGSDNSKTTAKTVKPKETATEITPTPDQQ